jgi:hypothetical protein
MNARDLRLGWGAERAGGWTWGGQKRDLGKAKTLKVEILKWKECSRGWFGEIWRFHVLRFPLT